MSCDVENSATVELPPINDLQIIEESEMEDGFGERKLTSLKNVDAKDGIDSADSDVCMNYDKGSNNNEASRKRPCADNETTDSGSDDNGSNAKDSGCEVSGNLLDLKAKKSEKADEEETPFEPPDDELANKIMTQVEFYFSDENISKDAFLLKHVKRNKEGYVSLKLISSFKRVKHLAKDWRVVAYALQKSTKLEVNEAKTKLRRLVPLPAFDQTTPSRTVVVTNLPMEKPTIENVAEIFREFGEIALIRILRPGNPIPADVRSFANKHPEINGSISALVEFDRTESAKQAIERLNGDWRSDVEGIKVMELNAPASEKKKRVPSKKTVVHKLLEAELSSSCQSGSETEADGKFYRRRSSSPNPIRGADIPRLQRRFSANRELGTNMVCHDSYRERPPCTCCNHCERRYSSSGSGYDSPVPNNYRRFSVNKDVQETGYQIPALRRFSGADCCFMRRCSRDSGSESSGSFPRAHDFGRRFSRDSLSSTESGLQRRFSRDSISSESMGNYRRSSRDSIGSDVFAPTFLSRSNSKDIIVDLTRRSSYGSPNACIGHHPLMHTGSRSSFHMQPNCATTCSPLVPENVVRMPKGPDGSKGFLPAQ